MVCLSGNAASALDVPSGLKRNAPMSEPSPTNENQMSEPQNNSRHAVDFHSLFFGNPFGFCSWSFASVPFWSFLHCNNLSMALHLQMEKTKMASFFSDRCVVHSVTLRIVHASSWVDADRCHDSMMTKTSWWFAQIWCRINKKGIKERKKDWKTKLTYQLSSTYISKIASWCVQRCHPGCNVPSLSSRTNVTRANAPQHPVLTASFASFDSGCNFRPMQPISQTKKFCNAKTFGEKSLILESLGKFGYDLVSHFIHICSFPFFASLCCYVLFDFSVVSISLPTRGLSRYPQPQASTYVQPNAWFLPNQDSKMICLDELLLKKNSKSCEVFCWESMWSIFRQDLQLMQLDSDRARLWSERSDVKCVKWLWFSCDFHVVDLSRRSKMLHRGSSRRPRNRPCNCSRRQCRPCSRRCSRRCSRECFKHPWCSFNNHRCRWCRTQSQRFKVTDGEKSSHGGINFLIWNSETPRHLMAFTRGV